MCCQLANHHHHSHVGLAMLQAITRLQEARSFTEVFSCKKTKALKQSKFIIKNCEVVHSINK